MYASKSFLSLTVLVCLLTAAQLVYADPTDDLYSTAWEHFAHQRWPQAEAALTYALCAAPEHPDAIGAQILLAEAVLNQGRYQEARQSFVKFAELHPDHARAARVIFRMAESAYLAGQWEAAGRELEHFRRTYPDHALNAHVLAYLGDLALSAGRGPDAQSLYAEALERYPDGPLAAECRFGLGRAYELQGALDAAQAEYLTLAAGGRLADDARIQLGILDYNRRRYEAAEAAFREALEKAPESRRRVDTRYWLGMCQVARGDWRAAATTLAQAAAESPADELAAAIHFWAGESYRKLREYETARRYLERVTAEWPTSRWADDSLAAQTQVARATGQPARVETLAQQFLDQFPQSPLRPLVRLQQAAVLADAGQWEACGQLLETLGPLDQAHARYRPVAAALAEAAYAAGRYELAQRLFILLTQDDRADEYTIRGWSGRAWTHFEQEQWEPASAAFQRVGELSPTHPSAAEAALMQAQCGERLGHDGPALEAYLALAEKYPDSDHAPAALLHAARLQERAGRKDAALQTLQRIATRYPTFPLRDAVLYQSAWLLIEAQRSAEADRLFQQLIAEHRDGRYWADATYHMAVRAAREEQYPQAEQRVRELLAAPCDPELLGHAWYLKGQLAALDGRWEEVEEAMRTVQDQFPNSALRLPAEYWRAEASYQRQAYDEAAARFGRLAQRVAGASESWLARIPLRQAQLLMRQQQWQAASALAAPIERRFPGFRSQYEVDYVLGRCLAETGQWSAARDRYERVVRAAEAEGAEIVAEAWCRIGETYRQQHDWAAARRAYLRAGELPAHPRWQAAALLEAGKCCEHQGDTQDAQQLFRRLLQEHPDSPLADEAAQHLRPAQARRAPPGAPAVTRE